MRIHDIHNRHVIIRNRIMIHSQCFKIRKDRNRRYHQRTKSWNPSPNKDLDYEVILCDDWPVEPNRTWLDNHHTRKRPDDQANCNTVVSEEEQKTRRCPSCCPTRTKVVRILSMPEHQAPKNINTRFTDCEHDFPIHPILLERPT